MRYLVCAVDADPCPPESVASLNFSDVLDLGALGIEPETVLYVWGWGFASVFMFWLIGLGIGWATGLIRKV